MRALGSQVVGLDTREQDVAEATRERLTRLAEEQAALRRVATLVARTAPPEEVFAAVTEEVGRLLPVDLANMCRYEPDRTVTFVATWGSEGKRFPVGSRWARSSAAVCWPVKRPPACAE